MADVHVIECKRKIVLITEYKRKYLDIAGNDSL